ncbi:hypothetical protein Fmac_028981 [Flemingia macrophylla]|uniref:Uncharacterized protein n=1 Tax=Flemingia macrophylla TaxID=520843 RepID=A0ABD1L927_9FABA
MSWISILLSCNSLTSSGLCNLPTQLVFNQSISISLIEIVSLFHEFSKSILLIASMQFSPLVGYFVSSTTSRIP